MEMITQQMIIKADHQMERLMRQPEYKQYETNAVIKAAIYARVLNGVIDGINNYKQAM